LNSKKSELLFGNLLIVITIVIAVLIVHNFLKTYINSDLLLGFILVIASLITYLFLATPLIDHFLKTDKNLKNLIDETLHELNTPIATIQANLSMLKKSVKDEKNLKRLTRIKEASKNLTKLYESIEYNIKENIQHIEKTTFDLSLAIDNSIANFKEIKKDITITNSVQPTDIKTDQNGFTNILNNLISNAIKYNKKDGFVKIYLKNKTLYIEDSGIGIDTKNLFIIFDKAYQENSSTEGFGIGLSIVKKFCDEHKIEIKIDTKREVGTVFKLDLQAIMI
jgi:signal transduction histidine kinase